MMQRLRYEEDYRVNRYGSEHEADINDTRMRKYVKIQIKVFGE